MATKSVSRRMYPRRSIAGVEITCYRSAAGPTPRPRRNIGQEILDISQGGARLRVLEPLDKGENLTIELKDHGSGESFRARGEIRWCASTVTAKGQLHDVGLQFSEVYTPVGRREKFTLGPRMTVAAGDKGRGAKDHIEKRVAPRFVVDDYIVTCLRQGPLSSLGLKKNLARQVVDLSRKGVQLVVTDQLQPGVLVQFTLHLNKFADTLETGAEVRWCRPDSASGAFLAGIQFLSLPEDKRKMIDFMMGWFTSYQHKYRKEHKS